MNFPKCFYTIFSVSTCSFCHCNFIAFCKILLLFKAISIINYLFATNLHENVTNVRQSYYKLFPYTISLVDYFSCRLFVGKFFGKNELTYKLPQLDMQTVQNIISICLWSAHRLNVAAGK